MLYKLKPLYRSLQPHLGEIRLVKIHRGYFDRPIELEMIQGPLSRLATQLGYQSLSYTWEDAKDARQITLSGQPFSVTKNLEAALRHLRSVPSAGGNSQEMVLWIDVICHYSDQSSIKILRNLRCLFPYFEELNRDLF
jgi:hypothetical protein